MPIWCHWHVWINKNYEQICKMTKEIYFCFKISIFDVDLSFEEGEVNGKYLFPFSQRSNARSPGDNMTPKLFNHNPQYLKGDQILQIVIVQFCSWTPDTGRRKNGELSTFLQRWTVLTTSSGIIWNPSYVTDTK